MRPSTYSRGAACSATGTGLREVRPLDRTACPRRNGIAHQIADPYDSDLIYAAIGPNDPDDIATHPDSGIGGR
ncbi:MAG TPA: hypothetical protein VKS60_22460 [Stellaceae bacterium]|nr:hypothetical protein [Stellaceae bacterium]